MRPHPLLLAILAALPGCDETSIIQGCVAVSEDTKVCAAPDQVSTDALYFADKCRGELEIVAVKGPGTLEKQAPPTGSPACCYPVEVIDEDPAVDCVPGRPYFDSGALRLAPVLFAPPRPTRDGSQRGSMVSDASSAERLRRALAWADAGAAEHASVAAFNRLSLQLLALGAPLDLLAGVQKAALEEVQHGSACCKFAAELAGTEVAMGGFPFTSPIDTEVSLKDLAYQATREGCLAETLGAAVLDRAAELAGDAATQNVLQRLAKEEMEHSVLSFRIVAWAMQTGGDEVRAAVQAALAEPWPSLDLDELALRSGVAIGSLARAQTDIRTHVLRPATSALLS